MQKINNQQTISTQDFDITTTEKINLEAPKFKQKIILTITRRHYYDPAKHKIITDQILHRARYSLNKKKGESNERRK
jgi:hypothetical protein